MKKSFILPLVLALVMSVGAAQADMQIEGKVEAVRTRSILAPYTGVVEDFDVRVGDELKVGEALFELRAEPVYADFDGVITGVFAEAGDSTASVQSRYSGLCWMERGVIYEGRCTTSGSASDSENKRLHVGETLYLRSKVNDSRKGVGRVISVSGTSYTIEVTDPGKLNHDDGFRAFRSSDYSSDSCVGSGMLSRVDPIAVTADGWVRSVYVRNGQKVIRGELLFEIVPDALDNMTGSDGFAKMPENGVVLSVEAKSGVQSAKNAVLATYCTADDVRVVCPTDEDDLAGLSVGAEVLVTLDACPGETVKGRVEKIAAVSQDGSFDVTIRLENLDSARIGMSATVAF